MSDTSLMLIPVEMTAVQLFAPGKADEVLSSIETAARAEAAKLDSSTEEGRTAIKSMAYKVKRTKTATDKMRLDLVAGEKKRLKKIDEEGARMWDRLESLEKEIRKPVTDYEDAEKARVKALEDRVAALEATYAFEFDPTIEQVSERLEKAKNADMENRQEFDRRLLAAQKQAVLVLEGMLSGLKAKEAERLAEIERQKAEAERIQKERKAAAAAKAKAEAEEKARRDAFEAERRAKGEKERIEREAREREAAIERERKAAEERAAQAERDRIAAEEKAKRDAEAAAKRAEEEKQAAIRAEQERAERERKAEEEAERKRAANRAHAAKINNEASSAIVTALENAAEGVDEPMSYSEYAKAIVTAIAKGQVPHVSIQY